MTLQAGEQAPSFSLSTDEGKTLSLSDLKGKRLVLYFYPHADTPGCTTEACGIRDQYGDFQKLGVPVIGASPDTVEDQAAFKSKYLLPFTLLADKDHQLAEQYGVWVERERNGQKSMGIQRATYVIGPDGKIEQVFPQVTPANHAQELIEALRQ